jgi:hypothetical protein
LPSVLQSKGYSVSEVTGLLSKMAVELSNESTTPRYQMVLSEHKVDMNALIGKVIHLTFHGEIHCQNCNRKVKKSYSGGFCFPCSQKLAKCDLCFMKPETCHFEQGTCREPEWGQAVCMQDHIVYLANSSGIKVGITRNGQVPTRWIDQGATQAIPIFKVKTRFQSGLVEVMFKQHVSDRTDWRKMLKGQAESVDLENVRQQLMVECADEIEVLKQRFGNDEIVPLNNQDSLTIEYPVETYPTKVSSFNFDKTPEVTGLLKGIKGQYLIFDKGVINIRKFTGYNVTMRVGG